MKILRTHFRPSFIIATLLVFLCAGFAADAATKIRISGMTVKHRQQIKVTQKAKRVKATKQSSIVNYFKYLSDDNHKVLKTVEQQGPQLDLYNYGDVNPGNAASGASKPTMITREEFLADAPLGPMYLMTNWWCSAAAVYLSYTPDAVTTVPLGLYSGDCTNRNAMITGRFYAQRLGVFDPAVPLTFTFRNVDPEDQTIVQKISTEPGECDINYYKSLAHPKVYGAQYTCDDGYTMGVRNDIQFTVYIFPKNWPDSENTPAVLKDQSNDTDKDGLVNRVELLIGTKTDKADTDGDGLKDGDEFYAYETSPLYKDTDGDGVSDKTEVDQKSNPLGPGAATDEQSARWARMKNSTAPVISGTTVTFSGGQATVSWSTDVSADGIVNWGPTTAYGSHRSDFAFTKSHAISFTVTSGTTYHYAIRGCSTAPNPKCTTSADATFVAP
ncbi:MAG: hypothetical protein V1907_04305 [Candidatus Kerfeldbacteria bacterium]